MALGAFLGRVPLEVFTYSQPAVSLLIYFPLIALGIYQYGIRGYSQFWGRVLGERLNEEDSGFIDRMVALSFLLSGIAASMFFVMTLNRLSQGVESIGRSISMVAIAGLFGALPGVLLLPVRKPADRNTQSGSSQTKKVAGFVAFSFFMIVGAFATTMWLLSSGH